MLSIRKVLEESWNKTWDNIELLTGVTILLLIGGFIWSLLQPLLLHPALLVLSGIFSFLAGWLIKIMYTKLFLDLLDNKKIGFNAQFPDGGLFVRYIVGSVLFGALVIAPIIVFLLLAYLLDINSVAEFLLLHPNAEPFLIWLGMGIFVLVTLWVIVTNITFGFQRLLIVDKDLGPAASLRESRIITRGNRFRLFILTVVLALINFVGALLFFIGLLFTIPFSFFALSIAYRHLLAVKETPISEAF